MDVVERMVTGASPDELFDLVSDLSNYPDWLGLVVRAEPDEDADHEDAWLVELRAQLGPLARSKRLRMVRAEEPAARAVTFERHEVDVRDHSLCLLHAAVDEDREGSTLTVRLHYGGRLFGPVLERALRDEIRRARANLAARYPVA